ncbi:Protein FAM135A-like protein [Glycine soja]|uniref:Protein FAM135A-like protein n=1 Tax=Glycine soja TaxID=3848 RepID=A0A0B2RYD4_GLYSO|nr:Protein FAM135A-like protein [Glycine soja]
MPRSAKVKSVATLETVREIGVYIQRFHNLDLFKQGWYRIKITVRWEDSENMSFGIPASVVQYEAPDMDPSSIYGVWRIDDTDNSFSTQSFRIKYARQDVHLYMMIVFNLSCSEFVDLATTAVILKFELRYAPATEVGADMQASPDDSPAAIHEFRIPPKALIGLHSYCPVHFDALHAVLVDVSIHVTLLKAASYSSALELPRDNKTKILGFLCDSWAKDRKAEWSIWMLYSKVEMPHHYINSKSEESSHRGVHRRVSSLWKLPDDPLQTATTRAELHRRSIEQMRINNRSVQDMQIFGDLLHTPIVIVEHVMNVPRHCPSANSLLKHIGSIDSDGLPIGLSSDTIGKKFAPQSNARVLKIVVFVHGFQACLGHHLDLRLVRNQWLLIDPKVDFLMSEANEDKTFGDFREMGHRLAKEVIAFLKSKMDKASRYGSLGDIRLSFVGHSIGNLIIRTAIADSIMEPFLCHLYTYVSVSGPHLGYLYSSNSLFNSGLWFLKKLKGTQCIHQLTFTDDPDFQNTFLYKLCKQKTLEHFRNIILLSSPQDGYVPYHSARIESCQAASRDTSKKGKLFLEMLNACLDQIRANSMQRGVFMRCDVNFDASTQGKNLDSIIGRAAHIEFLDSDIFARFIMWSFPDLFR